MRWGGDMEEGAIIALHIISWTGGKVRKRLKAEKRQKRYTELCVSRKKKYRETTNSTALHKVCSMNFVWWVEYNEGVCRWNNHSTFWSPGQIYWKKQAQILMGVIRKRWKKSFLIRASTCCRGFCIANLPNYMEWKTGNFVRGSPLV